MSPECAFTGLTPNREWRFGGGNSQISVTLDPLIEINDAQDASPVIARGPLCGRPRRCAFRAHPVRRSDNIRSAIPI